MTTIEKLIEQAATDPDFAKRVREDPALRAELRQVAEAAGLVEALQARLSHCDPF